MRTRKGAAAEGSPRLAGAEHAALAVLAAGALVIPTILTSGDEAFRLPKELAFRAEAILLLAVAVFWVTARRRTWSLGRGAELVVAAAVVGWTLVTVACSTNRQLSVDSLITVIAAVVIFLVTCVAAQSVSLIAVDVLMVAACANAALVILQETKIWMPLKLTVQGHYASVGLLGNANDVGTFLVAPALAAVVVAVTAAGPRRWIYAAIAALLGGGMIASGTRTALGALVAALIVFALLHSRRAAIAVVAVLVILAVPLLSRSTNIGRGVRSLADAAAKRDYQRLLSERLLPFLAAVDMTRDHPLLGVGPGCFKYHYMAYRVALPRHYPAEWTRGWPMNWGEVHNDHLQVASETGLPGYALFLAAIGVVAGIGSRRRAPATTPEAAFARALRWPLATVAIVICLAQFPLELAAPRLMFLSLGALCIAWDRDGRVAPLIRRFAAPSPRTRGEGSDVENPSPRLRGEGGAQRRVRGATRAAAVIAAAFAIYHLCVLPYRGAAVEAEVERRSTLAESADRQRATILARENLRDLDRIATARRLAASWYLLYGGNCALLGRWQEAVDVDTRALQIDQRPEIYFQRGLSRLRLGQTDAAVADMATAARFNPNVLDHIDGELRARVAAAAGIR